MLTSVVCIKAFNGACYGMLVRDFKVFLGYLVCNAAKVSNVVAFIVKYTTECTIVWQDT